MWCGGERKGGASARETAGEKEKAESVDNAVEKGEEKGGEKERREGGEEGGGGERR